MFQSSLPFNSSASAPKLSPRAVVTRYAAVTPTPVLETYWRFAAERQAVYFRRVRAEDGPWTNDPILRRHRFTNPYRASDRVSQFLIRNVIYDEVSRTPKDVFFRVLLFKLFNRISTWSLLAENLGPITYQTFKVDRYDRVLREAIDSGRRIYSPAYIMPPASPEDYKHTGHLKLLARMLEEGVHEKVLSASSMGRAFEVLRSQSGIGDFLAYQYVTDVNYSPLLNFSEMEFVIAGPGARRGIKKCFSDLGGLSYEDMIRLVAECQEEAFEERGLPFRTLWGRRLQLIDCQNLFCELDKYARVAHPEVGSGRSRIKQVFRPTAKRIPSYFPPKWGLNERIEAEQGEGNASIPRKDSE